MKNCIVIGLFLIMHSLRAMETAPQSVLQELKELKRRVEDLEKKHSDLKCLHDSLLTPNSEQSAHSLRNLHPSGPLLIESEK